MNQICFSDDLMKVVDPLKDGLSSINRVYETLTDVAVDPLGGQCRNYSYIIEQIGQAKQSLQQSEQAASAGLRSLDENIENLTQDEGRLEQERRATQQTLDNLETEQKSNNKLLKQSEDSLEQAKRHLSSARDTLQSQEQRKHTAEIVTGVGAGLFVIPIFGWVAGSAMVIVGAVELSEASDAVKTAKEEEENSESEVDKYRSKVSDYNSQISQTKHKISQKLDQVEQIRQKIQKLKEQKTAVADLQENVRKAVHILSILSGRVSVVECQTRTFIYLKAVMQVIEDVMKSAGDIGGSQLLCNRGVPQLLDIIRENSRKLAAVCDSSNDAGDEEYY